VLKAAYIEDFRKKMTDNKDQKNEPKKTLSIGGAAPAAAASTLSGSTLSARKPNDAAAGNRVRQSFSGGVTKSVAVEVSRRRVLKPGETAEGTAAPATPVTDVEARRLEALKNINKEPPKRTLAFTPETVFAKEKAEEEAREIEIRKTLTPEELRARELAELNEIEDDVKAKQNAAEKRRQAEQDAKNPVQRSTAAPVRGEALIGRTRTTEDDDRRGGANKRGGNTRNGGGGGRNTDDRRGGTHMTVTQALTGDPEIERGRSVASFRRKTEKNKRGLMAEVREKIVREVILPEFITVQELANRMTERAGDVVKSLMKMGVMATINQTIDADTAELIASELGHTVKRVADSDVEEGITGETDRAEDLLPRPPVVTIMGHVDHGKTSLLDAIRKTDVVQSEAGGITQHIGAYQITTPGNQKITFIDTPGHAAFTEMRARGANTTDIVVLVVAADDGIMPQTVEALSHAKAAGVPIIVAINKVDLPNANVRKVIEGLLQHDLVVEELGGEVIAVEVSAKKKIGLDKLEEAILLQAEIMELKANPNRIANGAVLESRLEQGLGPIATVLVQSGTLKVGDIFVSGSEWGRVRALVDDHGKRIQKAIPGQPVEVIGASSAPSSGDDFVVVENETKAREIVEYRARKKREAESARTAKTTSSVESMFAAMKVGGARELPVIIKGDVFGSVEAINGALQKLAEHNEHVSVRAIHMGVGAINESDITLATATKALVIGFNVRANPQARDLAKRDNIDIRYYSIIYNAIDDVKALLTGLLSPVRQENIIGYAEIRAIFNMTKYGKVAGCYVTEGKIKRGGKVRLLRDSVVVHEGTLKTLKRMKDDVREVAQGFECGAAFDNYEDMREGDMIECIEIEEIAAVL
jgi:translation initiation factor IF-2